jgi:O-antigen/teichoic acid export membrane protein
LQARRLFVGVSIFAAVGFLALGKPFVALLLPPKYRMAGWMLQALGVRVALDIFAAPLSNLILAYGKTKYSAAANTSRLVFMIAGIWIAFSMFGLRQAIIALIIAQALSYFPLIVGLKQLLPEVVRNELRWYVLFLVVLTAASLTPWPA